jgi:methyl-accepting chemotaxis protein
MDFGKLLGNIDMDEVGRAVTFVTENQDDFGRIIQQFRDMPDGIGGFLQQIPEMLQTVGHGLAEAGEQAANAALSLIGPDGGGGARGALSGGANIMVNTKEELGKAAGLLAGVANELNEIDILGNKLLAGPAQSLSEGAQTVTGVAGNLDQLSGAMREISDILQNVGEALHGLGTKLSDSGNHVAGLMSPPPPPA